MTRDRRALITGITGQDGSYLAELLLSMGYKVYGLVRRKSTSSLGNSEHLINRIVVIDGDMTDPASLVQAVKISNPDEVYNLAAQSFVASSWTSPVATAHINALGPQYLLEAIRTVKPDAKFYQASTSELFGKVQETPQRETTPFYPRSPYGVAKLYGHWITKNYRESYGMFACAGILFNHESERRGAEFVTMKIARAVRDMDKGRTTPLYLGNINAERDWGHAQDYVRGMWLMLQQSKPDDFILASGDSHTVREFVELAFQEIGEAISWEGEGTEEVGRNRHGDVRVTIDPMFYRPAEVETLRGCPDKAENELLWRRVIGFNDLVHRMVWNS